MTLSNRIANLKPSLTLALTAKANELKSQGVDLISFGAGEPDIPTPQPIVDAAVKALESGFTKYTAVAGTPEIRKAIAQWYEKTYEIPTQSNEVIVTIGGKQACYNAVMVTCNPSDNVLIPAPFWLSYPPMVELAGATPITLPTLEKNNFLLTPESLRAALKQYHPKLIILNSPSNPTGQAYNEQQLRELAEVFDDFPETYILWDNIYAQLTYDNFKHAELAKVAPQLKNRIIIASGFSKTFAMTGWRMGFAIASKEIIQAMTTIQSHSTSNATSFAQAGALEAFNLPNSFQQEFNDIFQKRRDLVLKLINDIPHLKVLPPKGAFYAFINANQYCNAKFNDELIQNDLQLADFLMREAHISVVPASAFGAPNHLRISFATSETNIQKGLDRLKNALEKLTLLN